MYRVAIEEAAFAGRVVGIGYASSGASLPTRRIVQKELDVLGSRNAGLLDFAGVVGALQKGTIPTGQTISLRCSLEETGEAFHQWAEQPERFTKIVVTL